MVAVIYTPCKKTENNVSTMENKILPALYTLVIALSLANCVREIDFSKDNADAETLVVSGAFTDGPGPHILKLTRPGDVQKQVFLPVTGAQVTLSDDQGNHYLYEEVISTDDSLRYYQLSQVQGVPGHAYSLEIRLADGQVYRTPPEVMPARVPIDSAEVRGEWFVSTNSNGTIVREPFAYVYAHAQAPDQPTGRYLRWDGDAVYIFNEILKSYSPFPVQNQCFISGPMSDQIVAVTSLGDYQAGAAIREVVGKRRIDYTFEHRICFSVYQHSINRAAYDYWQKIGQLITPSGTIFDVPPARAIGNVANETHPDHPALGYFELSAVDTTRVYTRNGLLGQEFLVNDNPYCQYDWMNWPPVNHKECDNCLLLKGSTYKQPEWWQ